MHTIQTTKVYDLLSRAVAQGFTTISAQGSSRSGKTYNILIWLVVYLLQHPKTRLSIVRGTLPALKGTTLVDLREICYNLEIWQEVVFNKSELTITLPNGSWIDLFSTSDEQKIRGRKRDILYLNEANEISFLEWKQLKMRTTTLSIIDYNPSFDDEHWICDLNKDERTYHFVTTYKDNPFLEQTIVDEIESLQKTNPSLWQVYGLGQQAIVEGVIFPHFDLIPEIPQGIRHHRVGMDFGFTHDPTAIVHVAFTPTELYLDEWDYRTHMLQSDIIQSLKAHGAHGLKIISESADPRLIEEIGRAGFNIHPVRKGAGSVEAGLQRMQTMHLFVTERSHNIIRELRRYTYQQDRRGAWLNQPIDAYNHALDAVRYVVLEEILGGIKTKRPFRFSKREMQELGI